MSIIQDIQHNEINCHLLQRGAQGYQWYVCSFYPDKGQKVSWGTIYNTLRHTINKITNLKFEVIIMAMQSVDKTEEYYINLTNDLSNEIINGIRSLEN